MQGEFGYGLPVYGGGFTGTPNLGFAISDYGAPIPHWLAADPGRRKRFGFRDQSKCHAHGVGHGIMLTSSNLGKAARVILDETELVGLGYTVNLEGRQDMLSSGDNDNYRQHFNIIVTGREVPPSDDPVPDAHNPLIPSIRVLLLDPVPAPIRSSAPYFLAQRRNAM